MWLPRLFQSEPTRSPVPLTSDGLLVFDAAVRSARRNRNEYVATEHLLLGIAEASSTPASEALERAGITRAAIRHQCLCEPGLGQVPNALPLTPIARRVFAAALQDAIRSGTNEVDSLGLLLALARDDDSFARELMARVIESEFKPDTSANSGCL